MNKLNSDADLDPSVLQQMAYKSNYTESINKQMRVPDTITVAEPDSDVSGQNFQEQLSDDYRSIDQTSYHKTHPALNMEVPDRIVVSVGEGGVQYEQGETVLPTATYQNEDMVFANSVALQTPPRVLTLQDQQLDSLNVEEFNTNTIESHRTTSSSALGNTPSDEYMLSDESSLYDLDNETLLRKQVFKLHRRVAALERYQANRSKIDYCFYGVTITFWLLNGWFLYAHRRLY